VRVGEASVVGVAVPESGYAGEGRFDASVREERIAMPRLPDDCLGGA